MNILDWYNYGGVHYSSMKYLKKLRHDKGLTQQNVAAYLGITRQAYSNYENDNRLPDIETLLKLSEFFQVSLDTLLRGTPPDQSEALTRQQLKDALFGNDPDITDDMFEEVCTFVSFIKFRESSKKLPPTI